jgi:hypothetical protein
MQPNRKSINKDFMNAPEIPMATANNAKESTQVKTTKKDGPEEVLEESEFPRRARRVQNFVKPTNNNEALVEIEETDEPSIHLPPKQYKA